jgi:hypothetical protein
MNPVGLLGALVMFVLAVKHALAFIAVFERDRPGAALVRAVALIASVFALGSLATSKSIDLLTSEWRVFVLVLTSVLAGIVAPVDPTSAPDPEPAPADA